MFAVSAGVECLAKRWAVTSTTLALARPVANQSIATVTEYEYDGLGHRIGHRWDKDADSDLDWQ